MFGLSKRERAERWLKEIHAWIVGQSLVRAADFEGQNQTGVAIEACGFFLHAVSRLSFRANDEKLREFVFDSSVHQMVTTFSEMLGKMDSQLNLRTLETDLLDLFNAREREYGRARRLLSDKFNDRESAHWLAAFRVAQITDIPENDIRVYAVATSLMESLVAMNLARRIEAIEKCLQ
jgi:hypothetical protein